MLNASRLSYRGFGTHRCATEDTYPCELGYSVIHIHRTYIHNPHIRSGLQRSLLHHGQESFREQEGANMAVAIRTQQGQVSRSTTRYKSKALAHLMTILSEMSSAVLPYALKILVQKVSNSDSSHGKRKLGTDVLGSIVYFCMRRHKMLIGRRSEIIIKRLVTYQVYLAGSPS